MSANPPAGLDSPNRSEASDTEDSERTVVDPTDVMPDPTEVMPRAVAASDEVTCVQQPPRFGVGLAPTMSAEVRTLHGIGVSETIRAEVSDQTAAERLAETRTSPGVFEAGASMGRDAERDDMPVAASALGHAEQPIVPETQGRGVSNRVLFVLWLSALVAAGVAVWLFIQRS